jgi:hypothetical protein
VPPPQHTLSIHPTLSRHATSSSVLDYRQLPYSKARIDKAKKLYDKEISDEELADFDDDAKLKPIVAEFVQAQKEKGLTQEECFELAIELICEEMFAKNRIDTFKVFTSCWKTGMSYADFITDVLVWVQLLKKWQDNVHRALAIAQGVSIGFSLLCQCFFSLALGQPLWVGLAGLIGLKPLIDGYRDAVGCKPYPNQKLNNDQILFIGRITEVAFEAIPVSEHRTRNLNPNPLTPLTPLPPSASLATLA